MDPNFKKYKPGKSPMGMDWVPVYKKANNSDDNGVTISSGIQNTISIKLSKVIKRTLFNPIETVGYVTHDKNNIAKVNSYIESWIRELKVSSNGVKVNKGQLLFTFYSPALMSAQQEYLLALKRNARLIDASMKKLLTFGLSQSQILDLQKTKKIQDTLKIYAPSSGIISNLNIRKGMYIKKELTLMMITDLSHIWIESEVYASDISKIKLVPCQHSHFG